MHIYIYTHIHTYIHIYIYDEPNPPISRLQVIVGAHAVMANGGLYATASCHMLALAAQHHSVPLVVCAGMFQLAPLFPSGPELFNSLLSPQPLLPYEEVTQNNFPHTSRVKISTGHTHTHTHRQRTTPPSPTHTHTTRTTPQTPKQTPPTNI